MRQKALEKARLKSDEELGVPATPILNRLKTVSTSVSSPVCATSSTLVSTVASIPMPLLSVAKTTTEIEYDVDDDDDDEEEEEDLDDGAPLAEMDDEDDDGSDYEVDGPLITRLPEPKRSKLQPFLIAPPVSIISPPISEHTTSNNVSSSKNTV